MTRLIPQTDLIFDSPLWAKSRLGCKTRIPAIIETAWANTPGKPEGSVPEVSVTLTDDAAIRILNKEHRGKDKPTNVLSFPVWDHMSDIPPRAGLVPIGDIIIAFETIKAESIEQEKSLADHLTHMVVHGFLHLLGYDHIRDDEAEIMESLEIRILKKLDIANPYE